MSTYTPPTPTVPIPPMPSMPPFVTPPVPPIDLPTLEEADAAAFAAGIPLIINRDWTLTANTVLLSNVEVISGGSFTKASNYTLTFNGTFLFSTLPVFFGFSPGDVTGLREASPELFEVSGTDDDIAINSALMAAPKVICGSPFYVTTSPINIREGSLLLGDSEEWTEIRPATDTFAAFNLPNVGHFHVEYFKVNYGIATSNVPSTNVNAIAFNLSSNSAPYANNFSVKNVDVAYAYRAWQDIYSSWQYSLERFTVNYLGDYSFYIASAAKSFIKLDTCSVDSMNGGFYLQNIRNLTLINPSVTNVTNNLPYSISSCTGTIINPGSESNTIIANAIYYFSGSFLTVIAPLSVSDVLNASGGNAYIFENTSVGNVIIQSAYVSSATSTSTGTYATIRGNTDGSITKVLGQNLSPITGSGTITTYSGSVTLDTSALVYESGTTVSTAGTSETDLQSSTIPGGSLGPNNGIRVIAVGSRNFFELKEIKFYFGSTIISVYHDSTEVVPWKMEAMVWNSGTTSTQHISWIFYDNSTITQGYSTSSENTSSDVIVKMTGECVNTADYILQHIWLVEVK